MLLRLAELLRLVLPSTELHDDELDAARITLWPTFPSGLCPARGIELDVVVHVGSHVVVFEAKYHSGFGPYKLDGRPVHQLAVQWRAVSAWAAGQRAASITVVAVTTDPVRPASLPRAIDDLAVAAPQLPAEQRSDAISWVPWHALAGVIRAAGDLQVHDQAVQNDVLAFMHRRGVSRVFDGFDGAGIDWGWPQKGMWATSGLGWTRPQDWVRDFVAASYWPRSWPARSKNSDVIALYVLFDFVDPVIEVGYVQSPPNAATAQQHWQPHYGTLATELAVLDSDYSVAVDNGDWTSPAAAAPVHEADAAWLGALGGYAHLRVRRRVDISSVTDTAAVVLLLEGVRRADEQCPSLQAMLRATQQLQE